MKHPADGLYYLTPDMLRRDGACAPGVQDVLDALGPGPWVVTADLVMQYLASEPAFLVRPLNVAARRLRCRRLITETQWEALDLRIGRTVRQYIPDKKLVTDFMDIVGELHRLEFGDDT